jgi:hypothetical protein
MTQKRLAADPVGLLRIVRMSYHMSRSMCGRMLSIVVRLAIYQGILHNMSRLISVICYS